MPERYSLGFKIESAAIKLAVLKQTGRTFQLCQFLTVYASQQMAKGTTTKSFPNRELLVHMLMGVYDHPDFAVYRDKLENNNTYFSTTVGIPRDFSWLSYIPFQSLDDLRNPSICKQAIAENLRVKVPYEPETLSYDFCQVTDSAKPYASFLVTLMKIKDLILGTAKQEGVFEYTGFPKPQTLISEAQALLSIYSLIRKTKKQQNIILIHFHQEVLDLIVLEGDLLSKAETIKMPISDYPKEQQHLFLSTQLLPHLKMALMYGLNEGKTIDQIVLCGKPGSISLAEIYDFLSNVLGKKTTEIFNESLASNDQRMTFYMRDAHLLNSNISEGGLHDFIYQKMLEQERQIEVNTISSLAIAKSIKSNTGITKNDSAEQLISFGLAVHSYISGESNPNLASHSTGKDPLLLQRISQRYFSERSLNVLLALVLLYIAVVFWQYHKLDTLLLQQRRAQNNLLTELDNITIETDENALEWRAMSWNQLQIDNPNLQSPLLFPNVRSQKIIWANAINEIAMSLPKNAVVTSMTFEMGIDEISGEEVPLIRIQGYAPSVARVIEALHHKTQNIYDIRLESPVEPKQGKEPFVLVAQYLGN